MISTEQEAHILRLFHAERWPVGTGLPHATVRRVLSQAGQEPVLLVRPSMADRYHSLAIRSTSERSGTCIKTSNLVF